jgi:hypothetical protein
MEVAAEENRLDDSAQLGEGLIRRVLHVVLGKAPQNRFGLSRSQPQRRGVFDHLIVLLADDVPVDLFAGEDGLKMLVRLVLARFGSIELLLVDRFETR